MSGLTEEQERAVALIRSRIAHLREPGRSGAEITVALRIEGWSAQAVEEAMRREEADE